MHTEVEVRSAKPALKAYKRYDQRGMFLFVTPSGARLWRLKYRIFGKEKLLALGAYPDVSLNLSSATRLDHWLPMASTLLRRSEPSAKRARIRSLPLPPSTSSFGASI
jgi:hypothetical protein